jgi:predicted phage gp36 major capsid-like protein
MSFNTKNSIDLSGISKQYAARDLPAERKLKYRDIGQSAPEEIRQNKKDLKKDLEERERIASGKNASTSSSSSNHHHSRNAIEKVNHEATTSKRLK